MENQIILYHAGDKSINLEVRVEDETVWLNRHQIAQLFNRDIKTIGKHISNALKEELKGCSVVAKFATTASDGKKYNVEHYSLDMILSIGYRVKSNRGIQFRIWANGVLKEHLLRGYSLNKRVNRIEDQVNNINHKLEKIDFQIQAGLPPNEGIFFNGQIFDVWIFATDLVRKAKKSILLIDNYVDEQVLLLLSKRNKNVTAKIYTQSLTRQFQLDLKKHNSQYPGIEVRRFSNSHDRFLILDSRDVYHIRASLKDLGKKWFAFSKINISADKILVNLPE